MRADGEISKEEYQNLKTPLDNELKQLQETLNTTDFEETLDGAMNLDRIIETLNTLIDFTGNKRFKDIVCKIYI